MTWFKQTWIVLLALPFMGLIEALAAPVATQKKDLPDGFEQILPRGGIAAINDPTYVSAEEAQIAQESWVLGIVVEGKALAYSLRLLNSHEIVNDRVGDTNFAAVW